MRKVDRLLLKVQEAERLDILQRSVAFIEKDPASGKWKAIADLWDGVPYPKGRTQRLVMECDSMEEAQKAVDEVAEAHTPTGKRARSAYTPVVIIDDILED